MDVDFLRSVFVYRRHRRRKLENVLGICYEATTVAAQVIYKGKPDFRFVLTYAVGFVGCDRNQAVELGRSLSSTRLPYATS